MATGMYVSERRTSLYPDSEKEYFLSDRFAPGEFAMVAMLAVASLLMWSIAIYGITAG